MRVHRPDSSPAHGRWLLSVPMAALAIGAVSGGATAALGASQAASARPQPHVRWRPCADPDFRGMECGGLKVPLDYAHPQGPKVALAVVERPAGDPARRIGTLVLNDAAGGSSIEQFRYALRLLPTFAGEVLARFNIVAMDPRGVGHSTPIRCGRPQLGSGVSYFPRSRAEFDALIANNRAFYASCRHRSGQLVDRVDMVSTARDFEQLRIALGVRQLNWYGIQYSDLLGRTYARLYPGRLRTMVLDSAPDDSQPPVERLATEIATAEQSFDRFASWCANDPSCPLHGRDVASLYDQLVARANHDPIPVRGSDLRLTGEDIQAATQDYLVIKEVTWARLATAIEQALAGDATGFTIDPDKTLNHVQVQVPACLDDPPAADTYQGFAQLERMADDLSPHLDGAVQAWTDMAGCLGWPAAARPTWPGSPVQAAPRALILQSTHQSLSAYQSGFGLAAQLPGSRVLSVNGEDYSTYIISRCVSQAVNRYLIDRTLPAPGAFCPS